MAEFFHARPQRQHHGGAIPASRGRVPEVSLHTAVKGQFGLGTGRAMGKALKKSYVSRSALQKEEGTVTATRASSRGETTCYELETPGAQPQWDREKPVGGILSHACFSLWLWRSCWPSYCTGWSVWCSSSVPRPPGAPRSQIRRQLALPAAPR